MNIIFSFLSLLIILTSCNSTHETTSGTDSISTVENKKIADHEIASPITIKGTSTWEGTINNKIHVSVSLTIDDVVVYGNVIYKKSGKPIMLLGYKDGKNNITLHEYYHSGDITGVYFGTIDNDSSITGTWYSGKYDLEREEKSKNFALKLESVETTSVDLNDENITGSYEFRYGGDNGASGSIDVGVRDDSVVCSFACVGHGPGFNIAQTMVAAKLVDNHFVTEYMEGEEGLCKFEVFFMPGGAFVRHFKNGYDCGFGYNATLHGIYYKVNDSMPDFEKIKKELY